ncbi:MAG: transposase [Candidatus Neomarinimicrobiota bacterium]
MTIKTKHNTPYFGRIIHEAMELSKIGYLAEKYWNEIPVHFNFALPEAFVVMPDHIHGIIKINKRKDAETRHCLVSTINHFKMNQTNKNHYRYRNPGKNNLSSIIGSYKAIVSRKAHDINIQFSWQPRFHDKIIWNFDELEFYKSYIKNNPQNWKG